MGAVVDIYDNRVIAARAREAKQVRFVSVNAERPLPSHHNCDHVTKSPDNEEVQHVLFAAGQKTRDVIQIIFSDSGPDTTPLTC